MELLNVEPLKSDPANATVQVVEFLHYHDWYFVVMPFCDGSDERPFFNTREYLEFAGQVLLVSHAPGRTLAFLDYSIPCLADTGSVFFAQ